MSTELKELLDRRVSGLEAGAGALDSVLKGVHRRRRRRVSGAAAVAVVLVAAAALSGVGGGLPGGSAAAAQLLGSRPAHVVRASFGIVGPTKGLGDAVIVPTRTSSGATQLSVVQVASGKETKLPPQLKDATVSPANDLVAAVTKDRHVVVLDGDSGRQTDVGPSSTAESPAVSWDRDGSSLFARVDGRWVRVSHPGLGGEQVRALQVPSVPGGPVLLSISPSGDRALLFGLVRRTLGLAPTPRLFFGDFDGTAVTAIVEIPVPPGALAGPMGWVGDNAFLLAPGPGQALIVRTDRSTISVSARGIGDPCRLVRAGTPCGERGPDLLGTNADGSLLFWKVAAVPGSDGGAAALVVQYYRTWLDGTHPVRFTGPLGKYGPPVAAR